jgi:hypothetical protein
LPPSKFLARQGALFRKLIWNEPYWASCACRWQSSPPYWKASTGRECTHAVSCGRQRRIDPHICLIVEWSPALQISDSAAMALSLDDLPNDVEKLKAMLFAICTETVAARAQTEAALAEKAKLAIERTRLEHEHAVLSAEVERVKRRTNVSNTSSTSCVALTLDANPSESARNRWLLL